MTDSELRTFDSEMASAGLLYKNFYYRACLELASEFLQQNKVDEATKVVSSWPFISIFLC